MRIVACMHRMALILTLALSLALAPAAAAASVETLDTAAPVCTGYIGVRCADGGEFCHLYVRRVVCVQT